jgi:hypothetical protein
VIVWPWSIVTSVVAYVFGVGPAVMVASPSAGAAHNAPATASAAPAVIRLT